MLSHLAPTTKKKIEFARVLRRYRTTSAEHRLWTQLRNRRLCDLKFRRQIAIGPFIVDFLHVPTRLIIELDGDSHEGREKYDELRAQYLRRHGYKLIRYTNDEVFNDLEGVLQDIANKTKHPLS